MSSKQQDYRDDLSYDIRAELESIVSSKWGQNVADTVEHQLQELTTAIVNAII